MSGLVCYCESPNCPNNEDTGTCIAKQGAQCFSAIEDIFFQETRSLEPVRSFGCLPPEENSFMQCKGNLVPHVYNRAIECCNFSDLCNKDLRPMYKPRSTVHPPLLLLHTDTYFVLLLAVFTIFAIVFLMVASFVYFKYKKGLIQPIQQIKLDKTKSSLYTANSSSGSGKGAPLLKEITISKQVEMIRRLGSGRYSEVWLGQWKSDTVAVKIFLPTREDLWRREQEILPLIRHQNILGYIATDISYGIYHPRNILLIMDYYEAGSLDSYLRNNILDSASMLTFAKSIASAIGYIHTEVIDTKGRDAVAHTDITSKSIFINRNGECVLGDFGFAVRYASKDNELDVGPDGKVASGRFMAPEVLNGTLDTKSFDAFKASDIYSLSLVFWQMLRRYVNWPSQVCGICGHNSKVEEYALPYHEVVPVQPSIEDLLEAIVIKRLRPRLPDRCHEDLILKKFRKLISECWSHNASSRLSAMRIKKTILSIKEDTESVRIV